MTFTTCKIFYTFLGLNCCFIYKKKKKVNTKCSKKLELNFQWKSKTFLYTLQEEEEEINDDITLHYFIFWELKWSLFLQGTNKML